MLLQIAIPFGSLCRVNYGGGTRLTGVDMDNYKDSSLVSINLRLVGV
jgi:curli biogenesis system outer membrane secretion channel CsgG